MRRFLRKVEFFALPAAVVLCAEAAAESGGRAATGGAAGGAGGAAAAAVDDARGVCFPTAGGLGTALAAAAGGTTGAFLDDIGGSAVGNSGPKAGGIPMAGTSISFNIPRIVSCIISQNLRPTSISDFIFLAVRAFTTSCLSSCSSAVPGGSAVPSRFRLAPPVVLGLLLTLTSSALLPEAAAAVVVVVSLVLTCRTRCRLILCTVAVDRINPFNACPPNNCRDTQSVLSFQSHFSNKPGISFSGTVGKGGNGDDAAVVAGVLDTTVGLLPLAPAAEPAALGGGILGCCVVAVGWLLGLDVGGPAVAAFVVALFGEAAAAAAGAMGGGGFWDSGGCKLFSACAAAAVEVCAAPGGTKLMAAG